MAQQYPVWSDPSNLESEQNRSLHFSRDQWEELGRLTAQPAVRARRVQSTGRVLLWGALAAVVGALGIGVYLFLVEPAIVQNRTQTVEDFETTQPAGPVQPHAKKHASARRGGVPKEDTLAAVPPSPDATSIVTPVWPETPPPLNAEVITGSGPQQVRINSLTYQIDVKQGTVLLIRNRGPVPGAPDSITVAPQSAHMEGTVEMRLFTDNTGTVRQVQVLSGPAPLAAPAIDAVRQWQLVSAADHRKPVEGTATVRVTFSPPMEYRPARGGR